MPARGKLSRFCAAVALLGVLAASSSRTAAATEALRATPAPRTALLVRIVHAGGGPAEFRTLALVRELAGEQAGEIVAAVVKQFGADPVKQGVALLDFAVADIAREQDLAGTPVSSSSGRAARTLARDVYDAGIAAPNADFDSRRLLEQLVPRRMRRKLADRIGARFGSDAAAREQQVLDAFMNELARRGEFRAP